MCDGGLQTDGMHSDENGPGSGNAGDDNNASSESSGNSGSQYALCALGVGLVALGIVMIVWSVVPADTSGNSSVAGDTSNRKNKASSVAFVLVGSGVAMLLLSLCVGMRNKQREQLQLQEAQNRREASQAQRDRERWVRSTGTFEMAVFVSDWLSFRGWFLDTKM